MKSFVALFAVLAVASALPSHILHPPAPLNPDGTVAETPEVAAVRAARLSELAKAGGAVPVIHAVPQISHWGSWAPVQAVPSVWWSAGAPLNADGTVAETADVQHAKQIHFAAHAHARASLGLPMADTPEVEAAKAAHFAAHQAALSRGKRWAPLNPDGTVADTPEVALAKAQHLAEVAKARGLISIIPVAVHGRWWGPPAPLNPDGTVADTAEVRAAKAIHFAAHAGARLGVPVLAPLHHGLAPLNIDGTVAETPEVVARKIEHFAAHGDALARLG